MGCETLLFWHAGPAVKLSPSEIARELVWGEEVDGLVDLPVRAILDRLRAIFPDHEERSGVIIVRAPFGSFDATWTWQVVRVECRDLPLSVKERLIETIESFGCSVHNPETKS